MDNQYNHLKHCDAHRAKECFVEYLEAVGAAKIEGEYRLSRRKCLKYLSKTFSNLPRCAIKQLCNNMILEGAATARRAGLFRRWVVIIQAK